MRIKNQEILPPGFLQDNDNVNYDETDLDVGHQM